MKIALWAKLRPQFMATQLSLHNVGRNTQSSTPKLTNKLNEQYHTTSHTSLLQNHPENYYNYYSNQANMLQVSNLVTVGTSP